MLKAGIVASDGANGSSSISRAKAGSSFIVCFETEVYNSGTGAYV